MQFIPQHIAVASVVCVYYGGLALAIRCYALFTCPGAILLGHLVLLVQSRHHMGVHLILHVLSSVYITLIINAMSGLGHVFSLGMVQWTVGHFPM